MPTIEFSVLAVFVLKFLKHDYTIIIRKILSKGRVFHSKMLPKKKSITLATAAVRHGRPSAT